MPSPRTCFALLALLLLSCFPLRAGPPPEAERAIRFTVKWDSAGPAIENVEKKELPITLQRGMPQLWARFYELRDKEGDVHFAGPLVDTRARRAGTPAASEHHVVVPDLEDARHLVIIQRVSQDPDTGRKIVLERDL